jgi:hypothetical protein
MDNNYAGMNGYVWWVGVVENVFDPLKLGRLQVRIIGWHTDDLSAIPSESLPWAQTVLPLSDTNKSMDVMPGDWVTGFFLDGTNGQNPVVTGSLNGITPPTNNTTGFSPQLTPAQKELMPQRAAGVEHNVVGQPTVSNQSRGIITGTTINVANNNREHVCDISAEMDRAAKWVKFQYSTVVEAIRKAVRAILTTLGFNPEGVSSRLTEIAKKIAAEAKQIKKILKTINDATEIFIKFTEQVKQMIEWISSLPAKLLALLKDCLAELQKSLSKAFTDLFSSEAGSLADSGEGSLASDIKSITDSAKEVAEAAIETVNNVASAAEAAASVVVTVNTLKDPTAGLKLN